MRKQLEDAQWRQIEDLLPGKVGDPGRSGEDNRLFVEAVLWIVRTGSPWRDLPSEFGSWNSTYQRFAPSSRAGVWHRVFASLARERRFREVSGEDSSVISSGLDFWFPRGAQAQAPVRWKQYLVTWSADFPLAFGVPMLVEPLLTGLGLHPSHPLTVLVVTGVVVFLMVYVVMPRYTRLIREWLFR